MTSNISASSTYPILDRGRVPEEHTLEPPRAPFLHDDDRTPGSSRSSSPGPISDGSTVSLQVNYVPAKFSPASVRRRKGKTDAGLKMGGGVEAFRAGEHRMPLSTDRNYDGVDVGIDSGRAHWNRFKWALVISNTIYTIASLAGLVFLLIVWFDVWKHADVVRAANSRELVLSTTALSLALLTCCIGWAGIVLNNRAFLAVYTLFLWITFALIVAPGYITYKKYAFNLQGKLSVQWSRALGSHGRLRIQDQLHCCGWYSPFVEATVSTTCYARSSLHGCYGPFLQFEKQLLHVWFTAIFAGGVPLSLGAIFAGLLCSNHITYRFGKGMMPKAYQMSSHSLAVIAASHNLNTRDIRSSPSTADVSAPLLPAIKS